MTRVYFILGCTASGKGSVGRVLAGRLGGAIVSVDSMKIYRRMDIGTAKPPPEIRAAIPHYCIDIVEPSENFNVAQYVRCADSAISEIVRAGAIPLAVGGTGLYMKALSEGLFEGPPADTEIRSQLAQREEAQGLAALHCELALIDPQTASRVHPNDRKRIFRALEVYMLAGVPISSLQEQWDAGKRRYDCVMIGITREKDDLNRRINLRTRRMIDSGLRDEVAALLSAPAGIAPQAAQAVGYAEMIAHLRGECSLEEAQEQIKINTRRLARKQRTWWRRLAGVHWFNVAPDSTAESVADEVLSRIDFS